MTPYEQGYFAVLEKLAVSPGLATAALANRLAATGKTRLMDVYRLMLDSPKAVIKARSVAPGSGVNDFALALKNQAALLKNKALSLDDIIRTQNSSVPRA